MGRDLDEVLESVGSFGPYQKWMIGFVLVPTAITMAYVNSSVFSQLVVPDHWCFVSGRSKTNMTIEEWKDLTIPRYNGSLSKCKRYKLAWNKEMNDFNVLGKTQECIDGWEHDRSEFIETVATTNDWLCEKSHYSQNMLSLNTLANAVGTLLISILSDRFTGRRVAFYVAIGLQSLFTAGVVWAPSYKFHLAFRFLAGLSYPINLQLNYMTVIEFISSEKRTLVALICCVSWTVGVCISNIISCILPDWRYQALASCVPLILSFTYIFCFPESPRWLFAQGYLEDTEDIFIKIAERNGTQPPDLFELETGLKQIKAIELMESPQMQFSRCPKLFCRIFILLVIGSSVQIIQGILIYDSKIHQNYFLNNVALALSELPGIFLGFIFAHYLGRRFTFIFSLAVAVFISIIAVFILQAGWRHVAVVIFLKLFMSLLTYTSFAYNAEIFPTSVRSTGCAWIAACGFTARTASPSIVQAEYQDFASWTILTLCGISFFASLLLPETIGLSLPQTFQEAEDLNVGRPLFIWIHKWNYFNYLPIEDDYDIFVFKQELNKLRAIREGNEEEEAESDL